VKWNRLSGLVLLLPHGLEGQGPVHSSARLERFLALAANDNMQVAVPSTPAQFFHLLRRQVLRPWRKPLIVLTPKSLLRHPEAVSSLDELASGGFVRVIGDPRGAERDAKRVLLCAGKVYYDLAAYRRDRGREDVAIVRIEQFEPLREETLAGVLAPYPDGTPVCFVQEEPANMGAACWLRQRFGSDRLLGRWPLSVVARPPSSSPATGSHRSHQAEQADLLQRAFE